MGDPIRDIGREVKRFGSSVDDEIHRIGRDIDKGTVGEAKRAIQSIIPQPPEAIPLETLSQAPQVNTSFLIAAERDRARRRPNSRTSNILARGTLG